MASELDIIIALQDAVRTALCEAANEEIEKQRHRFECEMGKIKREMVGKRKHGTGDIHHLLKSTLTMGRRICDAK